MLARKLSSTQTSVLSITLALVLSACDNQGKDNFSGIYLDNAYIKTVIPGRSMTAAYATIHNRDPETLCFVHFAAPFANTIELHNTVATGDPEKGRVRMERLQELCLAPGQAAQLEPGGMHLMVMGIDTSAAGAKVAAGNAQLTNADTMLPITLVTRSGRAFQGQFILQPFTQ